MNHPQAKPGIDGGLGYRLGLSLYILALGLAGYGAVNLIAWLYGLIF